MVEEVLNMTQAGKFQLPLLDSYQEAVVYCLDDNICVIADPATGKTRVVHAFVFELLNRGVAPEDILVFTFTKTGRDVMNKRFGELVRAWTQHQHGFHKSVKNRELFSETKDFDDLLHPRRSGEKLYEWVIMDEGQDSTPKQYESFLSLGKRHFLVGDEWQAMFTYTGADPALLKKFCWDFHIEPKQLRINHRSSKAIVEIANKFSGRHTEPVEDAEDGLVKIGTDVPNLSNVTILARTNNKLTKKYSPLLRKHEIPHTIVVSRDGKKREAINVTKYSVEYIEPDPKLYYPTLLLTIHLSKGDEWPHVLLIHDEPPHRYSDLPLEERVFYVGLTRAMKTLHILAPQETIFTRRLR